MKTIAFWTIPSFSPIVDLDSQKKEILPYPRCDYRADGIGQYFFFRLHEIYKLVLHRLLGALLSAKLDVNTKLDIIGNEFDIPLESDIRRDVNDMCNLSQGIKEQAYVEGTENGIAIGKQEGITIGKREGIAETIVKMYRKGYEAEQISDILDMEVEEVREIIENE